MCRKLLGIALMELLITVTVILVVSAVAMPNWFAFRKRTAYFKAYSVLRDFEQELYVQREITGKAFPELTFWGEVFVNDARTDKSFSEYKKSVSQISYEPLNDHACVYFSSGSLCMAFAAEVEKHASVCGLWLYSANVEYLPEGCGCTNISAGFTGANGCS